MGDRSSETGPGTSSSRHPDDRTSSTNMPSLSSSSARLNNESLTARATLQIQLLNQEGIQNLFALSYAEASDCFYRAVTVINQLQHALEEVSAARVVAATAPSSTHGATIRATDGGNLVRNDSSIEAETRVRRSMKENTGGPSHSSPNQNLDTNQRNNSAGQGRTGTNSHGRDLDSLQLTVSHSIGRQSRLTFDNHDDSNQLIPLMALLPGTGAESVEVFPVYPPAPLNGNGEGQSRVDFYRVDSSDHNTFRLYDKAVQLSGKPIEGHLESDSTQGVTITQNGADPFAAAVATRSSDVASESHTSVSASSRSTATAFHPISLNESTLARMASAVLYNAGLSHHLRGLANVTTQAFDFHRSLQFYLVSSRLMEVNEDDIDHCRLLLLAIFNNMAHIHLHSFDTVSANTCLDGIRRTLSLGEPSCEDPHFALNLLVSQDAENRAAPTA